MQEYKSIFFVTIHGSLFMDHFRDPLYTNERSSRKELESDRIKIDINRLTIKFVCMHESVMRHQASSVFACVVIGICVSTEIEIPLVTVEIVETALPRSIVINAREYFPPRICGKES